MEEYLSTWRKIIGVKEDRGVKMVEAKAGGQTWLLGLNGGVRVDRSEELLRRLALPFLFH